MENCNGYKDGPLLSLAAHKQLETPEILLGLFNLFKILYIVTVKHLSIYHITEVYHLCMSSSNGTVLRMRIYI